MFGQEVVGRGWRAWIAAALLVALLAAFPAAAHSATKAKGPARIDTSFGRSGRAAIGFGFAGSQPEYNSVAGWENSNVDVLSAPGGSTVIAGRHQIARFLPSGSLDPSFGQGGRLNPSSLEGLAFEISGAALDSQGRLLVFGTGEDLGVTTHSFVYPNVITYHPTYAMVARYTGAGTLDPGFGGGDGVARSDLGLRAGVPFQEGPAVPLTAAAAGAVDGQDRPIVVASTLVLAGKIRPLPQRSAPVVARFSANGDWDRGFAGGSGIAQLGTQSNPAVAVPESGSILVSGTVLSGDEGPEKSFTQITQLTPEGTIDSGFGTNGSQFVVKSNGPVVDPKGRLLLLQRPGEAQHQQVLRLLANGQVDKKFGHAGRAGLKLQNGAAVSSLAVDAQGRVLVAGASQHVEAPLKPYGTQVYGRQLLVGRLLSSGARDRQFGKEGWLHTGMGQETKLAFPGEGFADLESEQLGPRAVLDGSGRLLVVDAGQSPKLPDGGLFLARYRLGA